MLSKLNIQGVAKIALTTMSLCVALPGCLITSPYHTQNFADHTKQIPIQAWTTNKHKRVTLECNAASYGFVEEGAWREVTQLSVNQQGMLGPDDSEIYSIATRLVLPIECWSYVEFHNPAYQSVLRITQEDASIFGGDQPFGVVDAAGLECVGQHNGRDRSWFGWIDNNCNKKYSSGRPITYLQISASS